MQCPQLCVTCQSSSSGQKPPSPTPFLPWNGQLLVCWHMVTILRRGVCRKVLAGLIQPLNLMLSTLFQRIHNHNSSYHPRKKKYICYSPETLDALFHSFASNFGFKIWLSRSSACLSKVRNHHFGHDFKNMLAKSLQLSTDFILYHILSFHNTVCYVYLRMQDSRFFKNHIQNIWFYNMHTSIYVAILYRVTYPKVLLPSLQLRSLAVPKPAISMYFFFKAQQSICHSTYKSHSSSLLAHSGALH